MGKIVYLTKEQRKELASIVNRKLAVEHSIVFLSEVLRQQDIDMWEKLFKISPKTENFEHPAKGKWLIRLKD